MPRPVNSIDWLVRRSPPYLVPLRLAFIRLDSQPSLLAPVPRHGRMTGLPAGRAVRRSARMTTALNTSLLAECPPGTDRFVTW